ncbi:MULTISPECIES: beta-galactosidase [Leptolyngbya]|uniref:beta-galactosidase n=1 Tax=Leptolyngbya TaxID=47251 RepID=UPI001685EE65|nr:MULTISPECIES: beta-galactosidase [unclassified Leptolyngbya]MBD1856936.1 beta-galactosidase [Leptolyngbya sp. FACHB-1624]MBN8561484.1 beta-galactosidase [Leptolyngbya sp. UWPOB_LEPTO1]
MIFHRASRNLTRRQFTALSTFGFLNLMAASAGATISLPDLVTPPRSMKLGTTFSQLQCWYLGLDYRETFQAICDLGFKRLRLCAYWHELQPQANQFDFSKIDWLLDESHRRGIQVVLAVGMKAPRYPEFHFPDWMRAKYDTTSARVLDRDPAIADLTLKMLDRVVSHAKTAPAIRYWQVENEPFTTLEITHGRSLSEKFVRQEVKLVRSRAQAGQKILLTNAITLPDGQGQEDDQAFRASLWLADAIGFNVYTKVPQGASQAYLEAQPSYWKKLKDWRSQLRRWGKESWIAEAQAEPWEANELVPVSQLEYPSSSPLQATSIVDRVQEIGFDPVMLWGCEYWYWQRKQGRDQWWLAMQQLLSL